MKKIFLIIAIILFYAALALSQAPQSFKYQTVIRNASGEPISNQNVSLTIELIQGSPSGSVVCFESFEVATNEFGLVNLEIGSQNPSEFSAIDWSYGPYFVSIILNGTAMGTTQLLSVPYALYAEKSGNAGTINPWSQNGSSIFYNGGSVGIGTSNPYSSLDIRGIAGDGGSLNLSTADELHELKLWSGHNSMPASLIGWHNTDKLIFASGADGAYNPQVTITGDGKVGIGTSVPSTSLEIKGSHLNDDTASIKTRSYDGSHFLNLFSGHTNDPAPFLFWKSTDPLRFATDEGGWSEKMRITSDGWVGIGTDNPLTQLHIQGNDPDISLDIPSTSSFNHLELKFRVDGEIMSSLIYSKSTNNLTFQNNGNNSLVIAQNSYVGVGTSSPQNKLHVVGDVIIDGGAKSLQLKPASSDHVFMEFYADSQNPDTRSGYIGYSPAGANDLRITNQMTEGDILLDPGSSGLVVVNKLKITGGSDLAEPFPISRILEEGTVVIIDESNPGHLIESTHPYDKRVAGIVSGAGGIEPGLTLRQEGVMEGTQNIALTGRVYVKATAENGGIKPGDRLTTSNIPGFAMKASDETLCPGAVIGKAMSVLNEGEGLVLVLVNLQ